MAERSLNRWLRPRVALPALIAMLVITAILSPIGEDTNGRYISTRSTAINGAHGLRVVLEKLGWHTSERLVPYGDALDTTATYLMLSTPIDPSAHEVHALLEAVRRGASAIVVPDRGSAIGDSIGIRLAARSFLSLRPTSDTLLGSYDRSDSLTENFGVLSARTFHQYLEATPATDSDSVGTWPGRARTLLYVDKRDLKPEIAILPIGRGNVVAMGDPSFLRNDVLRKTAGAVLAVRILESIDASRQSPLVFDEYHQGYGERTSQLDVLRDALFGTTWGRAILQAAVAALLYLLMIGVRPIAPVSRARYERRSPLEHVSALSRAYEAIGATELAVQRLVRGVRRRHAFGTSAQLSDEAYLTLLRVRIPKLSSEIDTLTNALANKPSAEQLVSAGAAIDHIERNLIT
ncbi:MAG: DUF4350 domain-containing protein [Gemmatimonadota bacterium]